MAKKKTSRSPKIAKSIHYQHSEADVAARPDVGTQAQFKKKKPARTYRYDSSLDPRLSWDGQNGARELGEWLLSCIEEAARLPEGKFPEPRSFTGGDGKVMVSVASLSEAVAELKRLSKPFLDWSGKAERLSFDVPTLPLFVHERLSTQAILETLKSHKNRAAKAEDAQGDLFDLFADPRRSITDQVLNAYEHRDNWVNRMILGDSLTVMNSLLEYEGLGGDVQMIYIDPPYGQKFGSNFQPFVRKRDVTHNADEDLTREPEMVRAYRDTWELGTHSYLTYLRDRLLVAHELLHPTGSVFVQISDENLHHVRELMDEVFREENFISIIVFQKTTGQSSSFLSTINDYVLWYGRDKKLTKYHQLYVEKTPGDEGAKEYNKVELPDGSIRQATEEELAKPALLPKGARLFSTYSLFSSGETAGQLREFSWSYKGKKITITCPSGYHFKTGNDARKLDKLVSENRLVPKPGQRILKRYLDDFAYTSLPGLWTDTRGEPGMIYVVQTASKVVQRCMLMTTDPGDLVIDPTCGSGTTAYVAEQWGRRWITIDTSRVPLALARQRILTATFPWYQLKDESRGPVGGFHYEVPSRTKNPKSIGPGIVPKVTIESIVNDEPPQQVVLVDRPEESKGVVRVSGPFAFEAMIPTPIDWDADGDEDSGVKAVVEDHGSFIDRMLEVLRRSPVLQIGGGRTLTLKNLRVPAKGMTINAEATVPASALEGAASLDDVIDEAEEESGSQLPLSAKTVAIVFGPENGAVSEKLAWEAAREANLKGFAHLLVIGFAIQPNAREFIERCDQVVGVPATYVQATPDLLMGDLLKNMRSSQIFSVCGLPEIELLKLKDGKYQVKLLGLDTFDPATMDTDHMKGEDVPAWFLDTDYNDLCFHVNQAFFPRTSAWDSLKKELKATHEDSVWEHLSGTTSEPFEPGEHGKIAVKVIDDRGNELVVTKAIKEAKKA